MAYDGKVMRAAWQRFEEDKQRRASQAETRRRRIYQEVPRLEEIEREMNAIPGVERACCVFDEKRSRLRGFYVGTVGPEDLHAILKRDLPAFMVPGFLRQVEAMPLNKNGKIDRKALSEMTGGR